jgi:hypothetical protein
VIIWGVHNKKEKMRSGHWDTPIKNQPTREHRRRIEVREVWRPSGTSSSRRKTRARHIGTHCNPRYLEAEVESWTETGQRKSIRLSEKQKDKGCGSRGRELG